MARRQERSPDVATKKMKMLGIIMIVAAMLMVQIVGAPEDKGPTEPTYTEKPLLRYADHAVENAERIINTKKVSSFNNVTMISDYEYSAVWYPQGHPKQDLKTLTAEVQIEDVRTAKNYSIRVTADLPRYYEGSFVVNTSHPKLLIFSGIDPTLKIEVSQKYDEVTTYPNDTLLIERNYKDYTTTTLSAAKLLLRSGAYLDPLVTGCGTLNTANAYYWFNQSISGAGTCLTLSAKNMTINCSGHWINFSVSSGGNGITTDGYGNLTIQDCNFKSTNTGAYSAISLVNTFGAIIDNINITQLGTGVGIYSKDSDKIMTYNSTISTKQTGGGIQFINTTNCTVINTSINTEQSLPLLVQGDSPDTYYHNISNNIANGYQLNYTVGNNYTTITGSQLGLTLVVALSYNVSITNAQFNQPVSFLQTVNASIKDSNLNDTRSPALYIYKSTYTDIMDNSIFTNCTYCYGTLMTQTSSEATIRDNNITTTKPSGYGLYVVGSANSSISNNTIHTQGTTAHSLIILTSTKMNITNNTLRAASTGHALSIDDVRYSRIAENNYTSLSTADAINAIDELRGTTISSVFQSELTTGTTNIGYSADGQGIDLDGNNLVVSDTYLKTIGTSDPAITMAAASDNHQLSGLSLRTLGSTADCITLNDNDNIDVNDTYCLVTATGSRGIRVLGGTNISIRNSYLVATHATGGNAYISSTGTMQTVIEDTRLNSSGVDIAELVVSLTTGGYLNTTNVTQTDYATNVSERFGTTAIHDLSVHWWLEMNVTDGSLPIENAYVTLIANDNSTIVYNYSTNAMGYTRFRVREYNRTATYNTTWYSPYIINISREGYQTYTNDSINMTWNRKIDVNMIAEIPPPSGLENYTIENCRTINESGYYVLGQSIVNNSAVRCLNITANNTVIDCKGYMINVTTINATPYAIAIDINERTKNVTVKSCWLAANKSTQAYCLNSEEATEQYIFNNTFTPSGYGFYTQANSSQIFNNTFEYSNVSSLTMLAVNNTVANNTFYGGRYVTIWLTDVAANHTFRHNKLYMVDIAPSVTYALEINNADNINYTDMNVSGKADYDIDMDAGNLNNIHFLNVSYNKSREGVNTGRLIREWYYKAYVNDTSGATISGATLTYYNASNSSVFTLTTGADGYTPVYHIVEYYNDIGVQQAQTNYTVNITLGDKKAVYRFNLTDNLLNHTLQIATNIPPYAPSISSPYENETNTTRKLIFNATDVDDVSLNYTIYINGTLNLTTPINVTTWNGSGGYYKLDISAWDGHNTSGNATTYFFMDFTAPQIYNLTNTSTTNDTSWVEFDCIEPCRYNMTLYNLSHVFDYRLNNTNGQHHRQFFGNLTNSTMYLVNVTTFDNLTNMFTNNTFNFTTQNNNVTALLRPSPVYITSPYNNEANNTRKFTFWATDNDSATLSYNIYINDTFNMTTNYNVTVWNGSYATYNLKISAYDGGLSGDNASVNFTLRECVEPYENYTVNVSTTLCPGTYYLNDTEGDGAIKIGANNVVLDCGGATIRGNLSATSKIILASSKKNITITNCILESAYAGFMGSATSNITIKDNIFRNNTVLAAYYNSDEAGQTNVYNNTFIGNRDGFVTYNARDTAQMNITNNTFENNTRNSVYVNKGKGFNAYNNYFYNNSVALLVSEGNTTTFYNNTLVKSKISLYSSIQVNITDNTIKDFWDTRGSTYESITIYGNCSDSNITSNRITNIPRAVGISQMGKRDSNNNPVKITNNTIENYDIGITISNSANAYIANNTYINGTMMYDAYDLGIYVYSGSTNITIENERIEYGHTGIFVQKSANTTIKNIRCEEVDLELKKNGYYNTKSQSDTRLDFYEPTSCVFIGEIFKAYLGDSSESSVDNVTKIGNYSSYNISVGLLTPNNYTQTLLRIQGGRNITQNLTSYWYRKFLADPTLADTMEFYINPATTTLYQIGRPEDTDNETHSIRYPYSSPGGVRMNYTISTTRMTFKNTNLSTIYNLSLWNLTPPYKDIINYTTGLPILIASNVTEYNITIAPLNTIWVADYENIPPNPVTIYSPYNNETNNTRKILFSATDNDTTSLTYKIYINNTLNLSVTQNITVWNGSDGYYKLDISAWDGTDSSDNTTVNFTMYNPPLVNYTEVNISTPYADLDLFGYGKWNSTLLGTYESGSHYIWYKNGVAIESGTIPKMWYLNFDDGYTDSKGRTNISGSYNKGNITEGYSGKGFYVNVTGNAGVTWNITGYTSWENGTIMYWAYFENWTSTSIETLISNDFGGGSTFYTRKVSSAIYFFIINNTYNEMCTKSKTMSNTTTGWHHFAFVWNNSRCEMFFDGLSTQQNYNLGIGGTEANKQIDFARHNYTKLNDSVKIAIGSSVWTPSVQHLENGTIDEIMFSTKRLTGEEIHSLSKLQNYGNSPIMLNYTRYTLGDNITYSYQPCNSEGTCYPYVNSTTIQITGRPIDSKINYSKTLKTMNLRYGIQEVIINTLDTDNNIYNLHDSLMAHYQRVWVFNAWYSYNLTPLKTNNCSNYDWETYDNYLNRTLSLNQVPYITSARAPQCMMPNNVESNTNANFSYEAYAYYLLELINHSYKMCTNGTWNHCGNFSNWVFEPFNEPMDTGWWGADKNYTRLYNTTARIIRDYSPTRIKLSLAGSPSNVFSTRGTRENWVLTNISSELWPDIIGVHDYESVNPYLSERTSDPNTNRNYTEWDIHEFLDHTRLRSQVYLDGDFNSRFNPLNISVHNNEYNFDASYSPGPQLYGTTVHGVWYVSSLYAQILGNTSHANYFYGTAWHAGGHGTYDYGMWENSTNGYTPYPVYNYTLLFQTNIRPGQIIYFVNNSAESTDPVNYYDYVDILPSGNRVAIINKYEGYVTVNLSTETGTKSWTDLETGEVYTEPNAYINVPGLDIVMLGLTTTPPSTVTILSPYNGEINSTRKITFFSTDNDTSSLTYAIYINNTLNLTTLQNITTWNGSDGYYELDISAYDGMNSSANTTVSFYHDTHKPTFSNQLLGNTPKYGETAIMNITIDDVFPLSKRFWWNTTGAFANDTAAAYTVGNQTTSKPITLIKNNTICWGYWANDTAGNSNSSETSCFTVLNTPPTVPTIIYPPDTSTVWQLINISLNVTSWDADADSITFYHFINGTLNSTSIDSNSTLNASEGLWQYNVTACDVMNCSVNATSMFTINLTIPISTDFKIYVEEYGIEWVKLNWT